MAGELVSFGLQKLWNLLSQECERFQGVEDQVAELKRALNLLSSFLKDAYAKKQTRAVVKNCVEDIKEIVYDAEDIIETYLLKEEVEKPSGIKKHIRRLASIIPERREIASDMRGISKRISKVICDMEKFGVQQIITDGIDSQPFQERLREMRQEFATEYKNDLVGLEDNVKRLVGYLVEEDGIQVVSITGMGGLGKTTLARQAFNHEMVKTKFDRLVWVCVSQVFTRISVWQTILRTLRPNEEEDKISEMTESTLQDKLFRLLETSKSMIVLDDIWKEEDWDLIKPIFPPGKGWKVLLTSRNERVAMRSNTTYINFKPKCLTTKDSWTLFQRIALPKKDASELKVDKEMEKMGKKMIERCGGLPLAVRVFGGLLAEKYTLHDWKQVSQNLGSHLMGRTDFNDDNNSSFYHVLSLSFEELPSNLKHCFLYLAHFPEDYQISVEKLSYYWAAEGFAKPRHSNGETIRDVGDRYIEELVRRNMVISERDTKTLRFETCHMHDMMREICLFKAKEENILQLNGIISPTANSQPRRCVWQNPSTLDVERFINNQKLRSLLVILDLEGNYWRLYGSRFTRLELLRVLDLDKARFEGGKLPSGIGKLIHLRYLSLFDAKVSHLPSSLRNLKLLIYLNMNVDYMFVPNVLMGMKELRYLALPRHMDEKTKLELSNLVNLETLINFSTCQSSLHDLHGMAILRTLKITSTEASIETISASMAGLRHLENLDVVSCNSSGRVNEGVVLDFNDLKQLRLSTYMPILPGAKHLASHLTYISLQNCRLKNDPMPILERLLQLKEVELRGKSFCGKRMVCSAGGFPQLQKLVLYGLKEWEEWTVEEGSMPILHTLFIRCCPKWKEWRIEEGSMSLLHTLNVRTCRKLTKLPDGLRLIYSLKELIVYNMDERFTFSFEDLKLDKELRKRLSVGGKDHYKVKHIPSVRVRFDRL